VTRFAPLLLAAVLVLAPRVAPAQAVAPRAIDIPAWFAETFLDLREDVREAAKDGKRLMVYFGQDGCPYCQELMVTNFSQPRLVAKAREHLVALAINIWGDREVTWIDGRTMSEKEFAKYVRVQFTPTLLFLDEKGDIVLRLNGYYPPHRFEAALDYVAGRMENKVAFAEYTKTAVKEAASEKLHHEPFFLSPPYDLRRRRGAKPLAVIFETGYCAGCDELHREGFKRAEVLAQVAKFDVARLALGSNVEVTAPDGKKTRADAWARSLAIAYTPSIVFFDPRGREVFRIEAYLRPFHLAGSLAYVSSGAYASEPSFQRFLQARAERLRARGQSVEFWK
jgi:thioredoxin-related protein